MPADAAPYTAHKFAWSNGSAEPWWAGRRFRTASNEATSGFGRRRRFGQSQVDDELLSNLVYADEIKRQPGLIVQSLLR